jgi:cell division septum initiation protein DivIVA
MGTAELLFFGVVKTAYCIASIPSQGVACLGTGIKSIGKVKRKFLPAALGPTDPFTQIDEIGSFLDTVGKQRSSLYAQKTNLEKEIDELDGNLNTWRTFLSKPDDPNHIQIKEIVEALAKEADKRRTRVADLIEAINTLSDKERQLKDHVAKLSQCKKTSASGIPITSNSGEGLLKDDSVAVLARTVMSSAQSCMAECQELTGKQF